MKYRFKIDYQNFKKICDNYRLDYFEQEFSIKDFYEIIIDENTVIITNEGWCSNIFMPFGKYLANYLIEHQKLED